MADGEHKTWKKKDLTHKVERSNVYSVCRCVLLRHLFAKTDFFPAYLCPSVLASYKMVGVQFQDGRQIFRQDVTFAPETK